MGITTDMLILGLVLLSSGVTLAVLGRRQREGRLKRNWFVGLRTTQTLATDAAWHAAHKPTATLMSAAGYVLVVTGAAVLLVQPESDQELSVIVLGGGLVSLVLVLAAGVWGHRIATAVNRGQDGETP